MITEKIKHYKKVFPENVALVAVSKTKPISDLMEAYEAGQRIFGENKIQEMAEKWESMPKDIEWHMIGHVQTNKVKYMAPFVSLIHAVDSLKLLKEINKQGKKNDRIISCLIQIKIAAEDSKFGLSQEDAKSILTSETFIELTHVNVVGLMGMATFTEDKLQVSSEFKTLKNCFNEFQKTQPSFKVLSTGMSGDYELALEEGSTMVRIGSAIFGARNY
jgi:pyridoxal phosphate enzyme (YggS family)